MDCSTPSLPVPHHLPEFAQVHVHCIGGAIQPSHPLTPSSPSALNLSQHQGLFQWINGLHQMTKILELQHQSFQWIFRVDLPSDWLVWFPCCPRDSQESSPAPQFKASILCLLYGPGLTTVHDHWEDHAATAAKSLQSCPTLCDPIDSSPLGSSVPGILQARILEWVAISFSNAWKLKVKVKSLSRVRLSATPWTAAYQAPPSMGFSRQEYWRGLPLPSPFGDA